MRQGKGAVDGVLLEEAVHQFLRLGAVDRVQHSSSKGTINRVEGTHQIQR
jgi:hypothetical protein